MKRLHLHVAVDDIAASIRFYSTLFAAEPSVRKDNYAKWLLDDPRVNFAISVRGQTGVEHLGIQVDSADELAEVYGRLKQADRPVLEEGHTTCCYAKSEKSWITDPAGIAWEVFHTYGGSATYGGGAVAIDPRLASTAALAAAPAASACCGPAA
ncbi:ArsI/CadI family heavy metal resistance metalloenzyme [Niveispirillum sp. KHB5.9]|uniref:ArsI/CadI family heavy metal resistance metalloenzyme n=1 Tax=Niveispirillum sp. KHB5.9 TaxID=3400269 RepID=UPI003A879024